MRRAAEEFNDTGIPMGYLITFRSYGTWLHGDRRGSIDRFHNRYKSPCIAPNARWLRYNIGTLKDHPAHMVVCIGTLKPERALAALKANSTKQMRLDGCWGEESTPWAQKGSKRYLWNERSVAQAIDYVLNGQGDELPDFED